MFIFFLYCLNGLLVLNFVKLKLLFFMGCLDFLNEGSRVIIN